MRRRATPEMAPPSKSREQKPGEDVSQLRQPITLHGKPVEQILNSIHYGSPELRNLLLYECDMIFECKVCRALFRDLPNFISHKRQYCSMSIAEKNHFTIAESPEERVIVVQPQPPDPAEIAKLRASSSSSSQANLDDTIQRIRSGDIGHSFAFQVYSNAAAKLRHQKDHARITSLRPRDIPTNSNAVFVDVTSTSVNIHDRVKCAENQPVKSNNSSLSNSNRRKTRASKKKETVSCTNCNNSEKNLRSKKPVNASKSSNKKSDELTDLLMNELKVIQNKVKNKTLDSLEGQQRLSGEDSKTEGGAKGKSESFPTNLKLKHSHAGSLGENGHCSGVEVSKENGLVDISQQDFPQTSQKEEKAVSKSDGEKSASSCEYGEGSIGEKESPGKLHRSLICPKCGGIFSSRKSLQFHVKTNHSVKRMFYPCPYCSNLYYYFTTITRHLRKNHDLTKKQVDEMRPILRSKAFSKPSPSQEQPSRSVGVAGSRHSLRYKDTRRAGRNTQFVYSSITKGKKLSAIKDPLLVAQKDKTQNMGEKEVSRTSQSEMKGTTLRPINSEGIPQCGNSKIRDSDRCTPIAGLHGVATKPLGNIAMEMKTCDKCLRLFGRRATYEKHVVLCDAIPVSGSEKDDGKTIATESVSVPAMSGGKEKPPSVAGPAALPGVISPNAIESQWVEMEDNSCHNGSGSKDMSVIEEGGDQALPVNLLQRNVKGCKNERREPDGKTISDSSVDSAVMETRLKAKENSDSAVGDGGDNSSLSIDNDVQSKLLVLERPRRKRKVPSRNMEALDMLQKIHRTDETESSSEKKVKDEVAKDSSADWTDARSIQNQNGHMMQNENGNVLRSKRRSSKIFISNNNKLECYNLLKVEKFMDVKKLKCRKCNSIFRSKATLKSHVVRSHFGWSRFQCKLCSFSCFHKSECNSHISRSHLKLKRSQDRNVSINKFIIDLSKKGSEAMTLKKNQTLKAKSQQQEKEENSNIYKNQNTQRHPRVLERKLENTVANISPKKQQNESRKDLSLPSHLTRDRNSLSSSADSHSDKERALQSRRVKQVSHLVPRKPRLTPHTSASALSTPFAGSSVGASWSASLSTSSKSDDDDDNNSTTSLISASSMNNQLSASTNDNTSLRKAPLPFNISTRKSPRVFDTSPYNRQEDPAGPKVSPTSGNEVVMHTRHGTYTKTLPAIPPPARKDIARKGGEKIMGANSDSDSDNSLEGS